MKLVLLLLALVGCDSVSEIHKQAKEHPDSVFCYSIYTPEDLKGRYCTYYKKRAKEVL